MYSIDTEGIRKYFVDLCGFCPLDLGLGPCKSFVENIQRPFNPHLPSGPIHPNQLDLSISNFRGVWCTFSFLFYFE